MAAQQRLSTLQRDDIELQDKLKQTEQRALEAQQHLQQTHAELQAVSSAYADLEAHAFSLEGQLRISEGLDPLGTLKGQCLTDCQ